MIEPDDVKKTAVLQVPTCQPLQQFLLALGASQAVVERYLPQFKALNVPAGEVLLSQGEAQSQAYFVVDGIVRACHYNAGGHRAL